MKRYLFIIYLFLVQIAAYSQYDSIYFDGIYRTYQLHLPIDYDENEALPLIIAMHGGFGSGPQLELQSQLSIKSDEENFIVVYPEGVKSLLNIRTWNAGECCGFASNNDIDDVGFIDALLDSLSDMYNVDSLRIYATGMSNGAFMSYRLACELSHRIAAIAPVAGSMTVTDCLAENQVPIIHFHSYLDSNVPFEGGYGDGFSNHYNPPLDSIFNVWSAINNCVNTNDTIFNDIEYARIVWDNCDCNTSIEYYLTQDGGHSWPGGVESEFGDPVSEYINANDLMWSFFEQYTLSCDQSLSLIETPLEKQLVKVYPNPTTGTLILVGKQISHVIVYNIAGQLYLDMEIFPSDMLNIDLSDHPKGNYFIHVSLKEGREEMIKVTLQ